MKECEGNKVLSWNLIVIRRDILTTAIPIVLTLRAVQNAPVVYMTLLCDVFCVRSESPTFNHVKRTEAIFGIVKSALTQGSF